MAIALALREAVTDGRTLQRTAALITPDRALARRVVAALERWNVPVDDSGGDPLSDTAAGIFRAARGRDRLEWLRAGDLARAPQTSALPARRTRIPHRPAIALLERAILRGPRPRAGTDGLEHALQSLRAERETLHRSDPRRWLTDARSRSRRRTGREAEAGTRTPDRCEKGRAARDCDSHHQVVAALSLDHQKQIGCVRGTRRRSPARYLPGHRRQRTGCRALRWSRTTMPICSALSRPSGWCADPAHPARACASTVRWKRGCSRPIASCLRALSKACGRRSHATIPGSTGRCGSELGLDLPERRIGLSAHDFVQAFGAPEVILSHRVEARRLADRGVALRAAACGGCRRRGMGRGQGTRPALSRLGARARPAGECRSRPNARSRGHRSRCARSGCPVTDIEHWLRDPYTIYAKHILKLQALDPVDTPPGARDRGTVIHKAIGDFTEKFAGGLPADPLAELIALGREAFAPLNDYPEAKAFWWPRFERIARWFVDWEIERRRNCADGLCRGRRANCRSRRISC